MQTVIITGRRDVIMIRDLLLTLVANAVHSWSGKEYIFRRI